MVEKKGTKKPGWTERAIKWFFVILLLLLLIAALIFHAPWKVTILLLIILAACTVLPKPYRKWFWLSVAAIVGVLIIWVLLPEDNEGWRPYTFDEELAALEAKYTIPDSENAATIYNALLEEFEPNTMHHDFIDPNQDSLTLHEPWSSRDYPELAQWLQQHQRTITKLSEASKVKKCAFPIPHDTFSLSDTMDYLPEIRGWAFLLVRAGNNDMAEGRIEAGLEKYLCVRKMGDHMRQQSTMLEILVGISVEALALGRFKAFVGTADATEEHLSIIDKAVADIKYDWTSDLPRILECEKLIAKNLWMFFYEVNKDSKTRFSRSQRASFIPDRKHQLGDVSPQSFWREKLRKVGAVWAWLILPPTPQKAAAITDIAFKPFYEMAEPDFDWQKEPKKFSLRSVKLNYRFTLEMMLHLLWPAYYRIHDLYIRNTAEQRGNQLIIALRRYKNKTGQWPQMLDDIKPVAPAEIFVDPINGGSFVYKLTEEDFTLYSKGKNNIDEGGKHKRRYGEISEGDDWLIWPPATRKTKNEKADTVQSNTKKDEVK